MADGTYPRYAFLVSPYESPITTKQRTFNRLQEAVRKDVERLFSVLKARFLVALHLARYGTVEQLATAAQAVATLHTMVVELRRDGSAGRQRAAEIAAAAGATGARNGGSWVEGAGGGHGEGGRGGERACRGGSGGKGAGGVAGQVGVAAAPSDDPVELALGGADSRGMSALHMEGLGALARHVPEVRRVASAKAPFRRALLA